MVLNDYLSETFLFEYFEQFSVTVLILKAGLCIL